MNYKIYLLKMILHIKEPDGVDGFDPIRVVLIADPTVSYITWIGTTPDGRRPTALP